MLGHLISQNCVKPDPAQFSPLMNMPLPTDAKSLKRAIGLFSYYSRWISHYSDKIRPMTKASSFPLNNEATRTFHGLISDIVNASLRGIDSTVPLVVETDASDVAPAATLNQRGRPVVFFHRTLNSCERKHSSVEKEACAIVESIKKWDHFLRDRPFTLITDQRSVSFMFNQTHSGKIKNDKIQRVGVSNSLHSNSI
jgi:hypothetical protein